MKTAKTTNLPPLYTHPIGSLPRPRKVRELLAARNTMPAERFRPKMDKMVRSAIRLQEEAGLDVVSDGEWRRSQYILEFLSRIGGFERCRKYRHQGEVKMTEVVVRRIEAQDPVFVGDASFLVENTDRCTKFSLPSPFLIAVRYWHQDYSRFAYPTVRHFMEHLTEIQAREAALLVEAGIDIIQIDDPAMTYFCDRRLMSGKSSHDERLHQNWDIDRQLPEAVESINQIAEGLKAKVHLHCCHSVYRRRSDVQGNYRPILSRFQDLRVDRVKLEFAYPRTGEVDDLELLPAHLGVGMGVVDVRNQQPPTVEEIESIAQAGIELLGQDRIALNPDCGFAPDAGEPPTMEEAQQKLARLTTAARRLREVSKTSQGCSGDQGEGKREKGTPNRWTETRNL